MDSLLKKGFLIAGIVIFLFVAFSVAASATTIYVPEGGNQTIQQALNNATDGDIILVEPGRYNETVDVTVSDITIKANATDPAETIVSANGTSDHVFNITDQTNVTLKGFTIQDAPGGVAGIYMKNASDCKISDSIVTNISGYGIYLDMSDSNGFTDVTINSTGTGADFYEFYSEVDCDDNVATNLTLGNSTAISFSYANGIWIKRVDADDRPGDPLEHGNIGKYIKASNLSSNSWLLVNFSYSQNDVDGVNESTLKVWKYNGTSWFEDGWNESRVLDIANNVVGVNITGFSLFAPMGNKTAEHPKTENMTVIIKPETLNLASKGVFTAFILLPEEYDVRDINMSTVVCEDAPAVRGIVAGNIYIAKFKRQDLANVSTGNVTLTVTGELKGGTPFEGCDGIRVIDKGNKTEPSTPGIMARFKNTLKIGPEKPEKTEKTEKPKKGIKK